ncbi:hypothetical protein HRI_001765800 [Hibiscus trionum]|uniref:Uncharacterized protein n=1 Tax=Hibiscus trionum TaxID=183268 RepID=A0A9W7HS55_HIBTR|nr:hypothetical protein HRI_001765800 [Hibiscus trionum]
MHNWEQRHTWLLMLRRFVMTKPKTILSESPSRAYDRDTDVDEVPDDVKEGHFAVMAVGSGNPKRFILELSYLKNPAFLRLLEEAREEYGFQQMGILTVPCQPEQLLEIIQDTKSQ